MESKASKVDVIIPTYNGLPYLKEAIESVLHQTYKNLALYVIDDGSTDAGATEKYVKSLKDARVNYLKKPNGGQASARNYGIKVSQSPYVTFLDADDVWRPKKLAKQLAVIEKDPSVGLVYGLHYLIDSGGSVVGRVDWQKRGNLFRYLLHDNKISGSGSMVLIRREVFQKVGGFREDFMIGEDWEMWLRIAHDYRIDCVPEFIASLRVHESGMQKDYIKMSRGLEYMLPILIKQFKLSGRDNRIITAACLRPAIPMYFLAGDRQSAKRLFFRLLKSQPWSLPTTSLKQWMVYFRIMLAPAWLRNLRRKYSSRYRTREAEAKKKISSYPLISVVLPVYNGRKYLKEAINSILSQSFADFEFLIINDGSSDGSEKILDAFAKSDKRIKIIDHKVNKGLVASLNDGLRAARGKYIARMDADDVALPKRFEQQVVFMENSPWCDVLGTQITLIDDAGKPLKNQLFKPVGAKDLKWLLGYGSVIAHPTVFIRRETVSEGYRPDSWPAEDYELWQRIHKNSNICNLPETLLNYRVLGTGISQSNLSNQLKLTAGMSLKWRSKRISRIKATSPFTALAIVQRTKKTRQVLPKYDISDYYFGLYEECLKDVASKRLMRMVLRANIKMSARILRSARIS
jgi:glycosyltransferase involved in cell wall biosynthesis